MHVGDVYTSCDRRADQHSSSSSGFKFAELEMSLYLSDLRLEHKVLIDRRGPTEVMLSTLLERFEFSLLDKDIRWNISGVVYPSVGMSDKPSLPLMVQPVAAVA